MNVYAVILARGGSKGITRKNLRHVRGKSLLCRAIETCKASQLVDQVYVSSEDPEILLAATIHKTGIIDRPADLATDTTSSDDALLHAAGCIPSIDVVVLVQCTTPLLVPLTIDSTVQRLKDAQVDLAVSVVPFAGHVVRSERFGCYGVGYDLQDPTKRRQDTCINFVISGECWALDAYSFLRRRKIYGGDMVVQESESPIYFDIDSESDLAIAEKLLA